MTAEQYYPDRSGTAKGVNITATICMTFFAVWRLIVRFKINPRLGWSDYWLILALITALTAHAWLLVSAFSGEGRVDADPYVTPFVRQRVVFLQHVGGALNMYAMFLAKLSICSYLLALDFSRAYSYMIHCSIVLVVICNFALPMLSHWASCRPVQARWDRTIKNADCWPFMFNIYTTYIQGTTNVLTDLLYASAPIIYLRRVQLSRYTQWGVRGVFLCAILGTGISIAKPIQFARLNTTVHKDALYVSVTTTSLSTTENSVCIIVACLPPLRRTFDNLIKKVLPQSILNSIGASDMPSQNYALPTYYSTKSKNGASDGESATAILPDEEYVEDATGRIVRTTKVTVTHEYSKDNTKEYGADGQYHTAKKGKI